MSTLLQIPVPGGPELIVLFLVLVINLLLIAAVIAGVVYLVRRLRGSERRDELEELESRVEELETELESRK